MCMAEQIAFDILLILGFRAPRSHPDWWEIVDKIQARIDAKIEAINRVARQEY